MGGLDRIVTTTGAPAATVSTAGRRRNAYACVQAASTVARTANSTSVKVFGGSVIVGAGLSPELDTPGTDR
jgi:hypothetical protein